MAGITTLLKLHVNGAVHEVAAPMHHTLCEVLRYRRVDDLIERLDMRCLQVGTPCDWPGEASVEQNFGSVRKRTEVRTKLAGW